MTRDETHLVLARSLRDMLLAEFSVGRARRTVIAVAGESGSGKSTTALALADVLNEAALPTVILHQDDYFIRPPRANHMHRCSDLASVGPHEVNLALLGEHVAAFRAARPDVVGPRVD